MKLPDEGLFFRVKPTQSGRAWWHIAAGSVVEVFALPGETVGSERLPPDMVAIRSPETEADDEEYAARSAAAIGGLSCGHLWDFLEPLTNAAQDLVEELQAGIEGASRWDAPSGVP